MRVFNIAPGRPFLSVFVDGLLSGEIDVGLEKPLNIGLAELTLYVPTKRAGQALLDILGQKFDDGFLAPEIKMLGAMDAPESTILDLFDRPDFEMDDLATTQKPMGANQRLVYLTRLVHGWLEQEATAEQTRANVAQAIAMAHQLAQLLDAFEYEQVPLSRLYDVVPEQFALNWAQSLSFLGLILEHWPKIKQQTNRLDQAEWDNENLRRANVYWQSEHAIMRPIIALGSTGSRPATAQLLKTIAAHPKGCVILPGVDMMMDEKSFTSLGQVDAQTKPAPQQAVSQALRHAHAHAHPQYRLARLLDEFGLKRADLQSLANNDDRTIEQRLTVISQAMAPIDQTVDWVKNRLDINIDDLSRALEDIAIVEATDDASQAQAIAVILRETVQLGQTAALVTPDRMLARRVAAELGVWGIDIDDSAGVPLSETAGARLLGLVIDVWQSGWGKSQLIALLSHPDATLGATREQVRHFANHILHHTLRGFLGPAVPEKIKKALEAEEFNEDTDRQAYLNLCTSLYDLVLPADQTELRLDEWARHLKTTFELISSHKEPSVLGEVELLQLLDELAQADGADLPISLDQIGVVLGQAMALTNVRKPYQNIHQIAILGPLEARLQHFDRLILAGLSEGTWPRAHKVSPWASRGMLAQMGREPPERVIGLSAHDFVSAFGARQLFLTRSQRQGTEPSLPSRWLQRLEAFVGEAQFAPMIERGKIYLDLVRILATHHVAQSDFDPGLAARPAPRPPLAARPDSLSVTQIKTLRQDPYAIYAREILKLYPLDPLDPPLDAAMSGIIVHELMADLAGKDVFSLPDGDWQSVVTTCLDHRLEMHEVPDHLQPLWRQWLGDQLHHYMGWELSRREQIVARHAETEGRWRLEGALEGVTLRGRADRLDMDTKGNLHILDFKTGQAPTPKAVTQLEEPQLLLEALMARQGAFTAIGRAQPGQLIYVPLKLGPKIEPVRIIVDDQDLLNGLLDGLNLQLQGLLEFFCRRDNSAFVSHLIPPPQGQQFTPPYDHLARVKEWRRRTGEG